MDDRQNCRTTDVFLGRISTHERRNQHLSSIIVVFDRAGGHSQFGERKKIIVALCPPLCSTGHQLRVLNHISRWHLCSHKRISSWSPSFLIRLNDALTKLRLFIDPTAYWWSLRWQGLELGSWKTEALRSAKNNHYWRLMIMTRTRTRSHQRQEWQRQQQQESKPSRVDDTVTGLIEAMLLFSEGKFQTFQVYQRFRWMIIYVKDLRPTKKLYL